jgi:hypothetical protein
MEKIWTRDGKNSAATLTITYSKTQHTILRKHTRLFHSRFCFNAKRNPLSRVADLHHFNADPDPTFHLTTDPALDPDPAPRQSYENL